MSLVALVASPFIAYQKLRAGADPNRPSSHHVVEVAEQLAAQPPLLFWGSPELTGGLPFYLPNARPLEASPLSPEGRAAIGASGLLIACLKDDAPCEATAAALARRREPLGGRDLRPLVPRIGRPAKPLSGHGGSAAARQMNQAQYR